MLLTEWEEFRDMDIGRLSSVMNNPLIVDGRNIFSLEEIREWASVTDLTYISIGRSTVQSNLFRSNRP